MHHSHDNLSASGRGRRGAVFLIVLWVIVILTSVVLVMSRGMRTEAQASANQVSMLRAAAIERAAEQYVLALVAQNPATAYMLPEDYFRAYELRDGWFWVIRPDLESNELTYVFGLADEAGKLNLNTASNEMLLGLPGMYLEMAAAIIDWRDSDENITLGGAENEHYLMLPRPYYCKNEPFETVEELLLVRDFTPEILWGRNPTARGQISSAFGSGGAFSTSGIGFTDADLARGLYDLLTVYSAEPNTDIEGNARVNINNNNRQQLFQLLVNEFGQARAEEMLAGAGTQPFRNVLDMYIRTGMQPAEFDAIYDRITTTTGRVRRGLINVNSAPRQVLRCLPGLDENDVDALMSQRGAAFQDTFSIGWVADVLPEKAAAIGGLITGRSFQYSADIVALSRDGRAFKRCRIVVDARESVPRIVYRKDLTERGWPLGQEVLQSVRAQEGIPSYAAPLIGGRT